MGRCLFALQKGIVYLGRIYLGRTGSSGLTLPVSRDFARMGEPGRVRCADLEASRPRRHCPIGKDFRCIPLLLSS